MKKLFKKFMDNFAGAQDMTEGSPMMNLVRFSVPLLIGNIAQQLYATVDSIIVGKYVGDEALAAVGASGPLFNLVLVLFMGVSVGAGIMISQYYGAKDRVNLSNTIGTVLSVSLIITLIMMVIGIPIVRPFMLITNVPENLIDMASIYLTIIFSGIIGTVYYNILSGVLRGMGDSVMPLFYLLLATVLNIFGDLALVAGLKLGVAGVAIATIGSQIISAIFVFARLRSMTNVFDINKDTLKLRKDLVSRLIKLGLPSGITQGIFSLSMIVVQRLANSFGVDFIAANTVVMRVDGFAIMPVFSFGQAITTYVGQNVGAGKMERVIKGCREGLKLAGGITTIIVIAILIFGKYLMMAFTDTPAVIEIGTTFLRILAAGYIALAITNILQGTMRGAGDTITPMWLSIVQTVIIRVPLAYFMAWITVTDSLPNGDYRIVPASLLIAWLLGLGAAAFFYLRGKWAEKAVISR